MAGERLSRHCPRGTTVMSDRKYQQRGYQDDDRERTFRSPKPKAPREGAPRGVINRQHRTPNLPGFHDVVRCARCGKTLPLAVGPESTCSSCGAELHTCGQCAFFDGGSRFECMQPVAARVSPKDARNECGRFEPRVTVERQTHSEVTGERSVKDKFDDLFK
ncbi:MAG TPA: hypothetical protein DEQ98_05335 [Acidobacteria bacterium]|nr:hypothetical protein [Acidobacteriota bacterium]